MSPNPLKGARKAGGATGRRPGPTGTRMDQDKLLALLMGGLYVISLVGAGLQEGQDALLIAGFAVVVFLALALFLSGGQFRKQPSLGTMAFAFLGLATLAFLGTLLRYFGFFGLVDTGAPLQRLLVAGLLNGLASLLLIGAVLYARKIPSKALLVTPGETKVLLTGALGLILCIGLGALAAYFMFDGMSLGPDRFVTIACGVAAFSLICGLVEELWFRGLLLAQAGSLLGDSLGNVFQAAAFGVFETLVFYAIIRETEYLPVLFIIGAMTGYYWGRAAVKSRSLASPALLHAGLYFLILLPICVGLST